MSRSKHQPTEKDLVALRPVLNAFAQNYQAAERIRFDPVEFPRRFQDPRDIEVSGLLSASLAYGRADLFKPKLEQLHALMGASPAKFLQELSLERAAPLLRGFVYRFNVATDIAVIWLGMGRTLREHGSLEALFLRQLTSAGVDFQAALRGFTSELRQIPLAPLRSVLGPERGLHHLLPSPANTGAAKRLNLFLRWMVRGPDAVDLGIWKRVPKSILRIPLDTHVARISRNLGLTHRKDLSWKTAEEVTAALRQLDAEDPIRFDFALCHLGMSGACPVKPRTENCKRCPLNQMCLEGRHRV